MATWTDRLKGWIDWLIVDPAHRLWDWMITWIGEVTGRETQSVLDAIITMIPPIPTTTEKEIDDWLGKVEEAIKGVHSPELDVPLRVINEKIVEPLKNLLIMREPVEPAAALGVATSIMGVHYALDVATWGIGLLGETVTLGQVEKVDKFWDSMKKVTGFGGVMTMLHRAPVEMGLIRPLSYQLHSTFRNVIPDVKWAATAYMKGDLAEEHLSNVFAWNGYYPWYEEAYRKGMYREPRYFELSAMVSEKLADPGWMLNKLKRAEYSEEDQVIFAGGLRAKYLARYWDKVASRYRMMFKEGFMYEADFRSRLETLGLPDEVVELTLEEAKADYEFDRKMELLAAYRDGFKKDILTEMEFRKLCADLEMVPERIEDRVFRLQMAKMPKVKEKEIVERQGISIKSKPSGAHIYMDGVDQMLITPEKIDTSPGRHTIDLYYPGYKVWSGEFSIPADRFIEELAELEKIEEEVPEIE